ncbi:MAG: ATP-grasp domain-containing protein [Sandaracinaceae bacterium]|nr:hypothetical protein [Myxococcales bacterium]
MNSSSPFAGKHLLLIGTGGVKRRRVMEALCALGLGRITCLNDVVNWADAHVDDWILADPTRPSPSTAELVRSRIGRPDAVFTYDDYSVLLTAHLARAFDRPGLAPEAAERAKDKDVFRRVCRDHDLPAPRSWRLDPARPAFDLSALPFPVVVKPTHGAGSVLVRRVDDADALARTLTNHAQALASEPAAALWPDRSVVIEEYIAGEEVDVDLLVQEGALRYAAVSDNDPPIEPYFMEVAGRIPSSLDPAAQSALIDTAHRVLLALGVDDGCVHFEARWTERGAVPIEANLRLGGAEVYSFQRGAYGVDLVEQAVRIALGAPVTATAPIRPLRHLRSAALNPDRSGVLRRLEAEPWVLAHPDLVELCLFRAAGDRVRVPPLGFDYVGWIVAAGAGPEQADARLAELFRGVHVDVDPIPLSDEKPGEKPR